MLQVYLDPCTVNSRKVLAGLDLLGTQYNLNHVAYLTGDDISIADIAVAAPMHLHAAQRLPLDDHPNLKRWMTEGIENLPCWQKTQAAVDKVLLPGAAVAERATTTESMTAQTEVRSTF